MALEKVNLKIESALEMVWRKPIALADANLVNPSHAQCAYDGEWFALDSNGKAARAAAIGTLGTVGAGGRATSARAFQIWMERGRTDVQVNPDKKASFLFMGPYLAKTKVFDAAAVVASGVAISAVDQPLKVATIALTDATGTARNFVGLVGHGGVSDAAPIAAYVTKLPGSSGWLGYRVG